MRFPLPRRTVRWLALAGLLIVAILLVLAVPIHDPFGLDGPAPRSGVHPSVLNTPSVSGKTGVTCAAVTTCVTGFLAAGIGDWQFVIVGYNGTTAPSAVQNSKGQSFTVLRSITQISMGISMYQLNTASRPLASGNVHMSAYVNFTGSTTYSVLFYDVTAAGQVDVICGAGAHALSTAVTQSITTTVAGDLVLMGLAVGGNPTFTPTGSLVTLNSTTQATASVYGADVIDASTGAFTVAGTLGTKNYWAECADGIFAGVAPAAPTSLSDTGQTATSISLSWTNPAHSFIVNNTVVYVAGSGCSSFTNAQSTSGAATTATVSGLAGASQYCFEVADDNSSGNSPYSSTVTGWTLPAAPTVFTSTSHTYYSVTLGWTNPSGTLTDNHVYWVAGASCAGMTIIDVGSVVTSYTVFSLSGSTQYSFQATASSAAGESGRTGCATVTTNADPAPGAPTGFALGAITTRTVGTSWTQPSGGGILNDTAYTQISSAVCNSVHTGHNLGVVTSYTFATTAGTYVCEEVAAWNITGQGTLTSALSTATISDAATSLAVTGQTATSISLSWTNPAGGALSNATVYSATSCSPASWLGHSVGSAATSYTVTSLLGATNYCFMVQIWTAGGGSNQSATVQGTTLPTAPTGLTTGTLTGTTAAVSWTNPSGTLVNDTVFWQTGTGCSGYLSAHSTGSAATSYTITGLSLGTTYCWTVVAWSAGGMSALPSGVTFTTRNVPLRPTGLTTGTLTGSTAVVSWTQSPGTVTNNTVYWGLTCSYGFAHSMAGAAVTYTIAGLSTGTSYCWTVQAWNSTGGSLLPSGVTFTTVSLPTAPTSFTYVSATATTVSLTWTNGAPSLTNDTVYYQTGSSCTVGTGISIGSIVTSYTVTGLAPATLYSFTVQDWNVAGGSPQSSCIRGATLGAVPPAPSTPVTVTVGKTYTVVAWTNPIGYTILNDSFLFRWGSLCQGPWNLTASLGGPTTSTNLTDLGAGQTYCFEVIAWDAQSPPSNPLVWLTSGNNGCGGACEGGGGGGVNIPPPPCLVNCPPPTNLTAKNGTINIVWFPFLVPASWLTFGIGSTLILVGVLVMVGGRAGIGLAPTILIGMVLLAVGAFFLLVFGGIL